MSGVRPENSTDREAGKPPYLLRFGVPFGVGTRIQPPSAKAVPRTEDEEGMTNVGSD